MTLSCYELQAPLEITENGVATLVIENPVFYRNFIEDLLLQSQSCSSRFTLAEGNTVLNLSKEAEIITDIFRLPFESRTVQSRVNQAATDELGILCESSAELLGRINAVGADIASSLSFEAGYTPLADFGGIIKLLGFYIETEGLSLPEKAAEYLSFLSLYCGKKLFVILNLKASLNGGEFSELAKLLRYKKIRVLLIENRKSEFFAENETVRIIDNDLCEI